MSPIMPGIPPSWPIFAEGVTLDDAREAIDAAQLGDGLPLIPPTLARIRAMLAGVADPPRALGVVAPMMGILTPASVAYCCVIAGGRPEEFPVVLTALKACLEPAFNLLGIQTTTGTAAVAVIVHGPIRERLGVNGGGNCLGPGNRANASIGRAFNLALKGIGGALPGIGDMATMGQPGKYVFCFAEGETSNAYPSLHVRRGLAEDTDAVTVLAVGGTMEVLPEGEQDSAESLLVPLVAAMVWGRYAAQSSQGGPQPEQFLLLPPEVANQLARSGHDVPGFQAAAFALARDASTWNLRSPGGEQRSVVSPALASLPEHIHPVVTGGVGIKMTVLPGWAGGSRSVTRAI